MFVKIYFFYYVFHRSTHCVFCRFVVSYLEKHHIRRPRRQEIPRRSALRAKLIRSTLSTWEAVHVLTCPSRLPNMRGDTERMLGIELMWAKGSIYPIIDWPLSCWQAKIIYPQLMLLAATARRARFPRPSRDKDYVERAGVCLGLKFWLAWNLFHWCIPWRRGNYWQELSPRPVICCKYLLHVHTVPP